MLKILTASTLLLSLALLSACDKPATEKSTETSEALASVSGTMNKAATKAREEISKSNMSVGTLHGKAKAEITPLGDLLIDSKAVTITPEQRKLLIAHRQILGNIAVAGIEIGIQGVDLAKKAVGESIKGIFNGNTDQVEKKVDAEAKKIEASANVLCEQLPLLMESQQTLAESLPEFKPYATMTKDDIDDCHGKLIERK